MAHLTFRNSRSWFRVRDRFLGLLTSLKLWKLDYFSDHSMVDYMAQQSDIAMDRRLGHIFFVVRIGQSHHGHRRRFLVEKTGGGSRDTLVAAGIEMYGPTPRNDSFWMLLAYCAGTGGSCLIIGSAAGVAAMGIEKIDFMWYARRIGPLALAGYLAGVAVYLLQKMILG